MKLTINLKALRGDKVSALNYKKKPAVWELGTISLIEIRPNFDNTKLSATYRVVLDRQGKSSVRGRGIVLYVGEENIKKHEII